MPKRKILQFIVLALFFLSILSLTIGTSLVNSPDENANLQFAKAFAQDGRIELIEEINLRVGGVVHPRSMLVVGDRLLPRSFLGMTVLYGSVGAVLSDSVIPFLTAILAVLALLAWRDIVFRLFKNENLADLSAFFLMIHPSFWHYSARSMMHNIPFLAFLLFGAWFLIRKPSRWYVNAGLAGLLFGLALAFRTSEIIWVFSGLFIVLAFLAKTKEDRFSIPIIFLGIFLALLPFAFLNQAVYGDFLTTGYTVQTTVDTAVNTYEGSAETSTESFTGVLAFLFPFGIHEKAILRHVWQYGFLLYPWLSILSAIGLAVALRRGGIHATLQDRMNPVPTGPWRVLAVLTLVLSIWLAVVYGSWSFHDNPDSSLITVGNSYVRYWLPLFTLASVFAAQAVIWLAQFIQKENLRRVFIIFIIGTSFLASAQLVFHGNDGFISTRLALQSFELKKMLILDQTEENAVIIVDRADKYLFPDRSVVVPLRSERTYAAMPSIVEEAPLYYFGISFPQVDLDYLNNEKLGGIGLGIESVMRVQEESLYRIFIVE